MRQKSWEELGICDDFLFGKVMRDPEICRKMLETILDVEIEAIDYPEEQKVIDIDVDSKSVRLDVYVKDTKKRFIMSRCNLHAEVIYQNEVDTIKV